MLVERTGNIVLVYAVIGVLTFLIPLAFSFTPLGHAERYLPPTGDTQAELLSAEAPHTEPAAG